MRRCALSGFLSVSLLGVWLPAEIPALTVARKVVWDVPRVDIGDSAAILRLVLERTVSAVSGVPLGVELGPVWTVGGQQLRAGHLQVGGLAVVHASVIVVFDDAGALVALSIPDLPAGAFARYRGPARLSPVAIDAIVASRAPPGRTFRLSPPMYLAGAERWVCGAIYSPLAVPDAGSADPGAWSVMTLLLDGDTGEIMAAGTVDKHLSVSGVCSGHYLGLQGPAVRRAYGEENDNFPGHAPAPFLPMKISTVGVDPMEPVLTSAQGKFAFSHREVSGVWGLTTSFDTIDCKLTVGPGVQHVFCRASGVGDAVVSLQLEPPLPSDVLSLEAENRAGVLTGWIYLHLGLDLANLFRERNLKWPAGFGGRQDYVRSIPAFYQLELVRLPSPQGIRPWPGGAYMDAFPPRRVIGINEANDLFHDWMSPAIWHELGHAVASAFTGQILDPPPHTHDLILGECIADIFALLTMEMLDPNGAIPHVLGQGMERGYPESFHRDVQRGLVCYPEPGTLVPCRARGGFGLYPPSTQPHQGSLVFSGFFHDLWRAMVARYGRTEGFYRFGDHFFSFLGWHQGSHLRPFTRQTILELLLINDDRKFGGDFIPQNGSPDADLIIAAAAGRNLWLQPFRRGDVNGDGAVDVSDAIAILGHLFLGMKEPSCLDASDINDDGAVVISDAVALVVHLFSDGGPLPPPTDCVGLDVTPDDRLSCRQYFVCK